MALVPSSLLSFVDAGRDATEEAPPATTVTSWGDLFGANAKGKYAVVWRWESMDELREMQAQRERGAKFEEGMERARAALVVGDDPKVRNPLDSDSDDSDSDSSSGKSGGKRGAIGNNPEDDDTGMGDGDGDDDDALSGNYAAAMASLYSEKRRRLGDIAARRPAAASTATRHDTRTQMKIILYIQPEDSNRLCLAPCPTSTSTAAKRHSTAFYISIDPAIDAAVDHTVYTGGVVAMLRTPNAIFEETKPLLWPSMVSILNTSRMRQKVSTNVRLRIRLGRKCMLSRANNGSSAQLVELINGTRYADPSAYLGLRAAAAGAAAGAGEGGGAGQNIITSEALCTHMNRNGWRGMEFLDAITRAEFARIRERLTGHLTKESEVFQVHCTIGRGRSGVACRVSCVIGGRAGGVETLQVEKVKTNSRKYTVIDIIRPGAYDFRYDIRTTDNARGDDPLFRACGAVCGCLSYDRRADRMVLAKPLPEGVAFSISTVRYKRKAQYVVPGFAERVSPPCVTGDPGATKVSLSHTLQHELRGLHEGTHLGVGDAVVSSPGERYEAGAQLMSTKRIFDAFKHSDAPQNLPTRVLELGRTLLPNALAALQQLPAVDAAQLLRAVDVTQRHAAQRVAAATREAAAASDEDDDVDSI